MLVRVIEKPGAQAHSVIVLLQYGEVAAALAAFPELGVVGELRERHRSESQLVVHLHYSGSGRDAEYFGVGEQLP